MRLRTCASPSRPLRRAGCGRASERASRAGSFSVFQAITNEAQMFTPRAFWTDRKKVEGQLLGKVACRRDAARDAAESGRRAAVRIGVGEETPPSRRLGSFLFCSQVEPSSRWGGL